MEYFNTNGFPKPIEDFDDITTICKLKLIGPFHFSDKGSCTSTLSHSLNTISLSRLHSYCIEGPSRSRLDEWFLPGRHQALRQRSSPFFPEVHDEFTKSWRAPYSSRIRASTSAALTSVDGAEEKGYEHLPPLDESVAAHLCPPTAIRGKARATHPSKPCRATSALVRHAYSEAGLAASVLHSMAVLQVFQANMLANEDAGLDSASLRDLRSATDLALHATKATAKAIGCSMSSLIVLERHLWLTMMEMKVADKIPFLDALISSGSLFGPAVEGFAERYTEAQKSSQAMRHFLPKCTSSSSASSRPKSAPTQQTAKPAPTTPEPWPPEERRDRGRSRSTRCYNFPKHQGPRPKNALVPVPKKSSWSARQKEEGPESRYHRPTLQTASHVSLATSRNAGCREKCFRFLTGPLRRPGVWPLW